MIVLSFVVALAVLSGSGATAYIGGSIGGQDARTDAQELADEKNVTGQAAANEGSIVGLVVGGARDLADVVALAVYFPSTLKAIGLPNWLADPLGIVANIVAFVGILQFISGRIYE
jgi:hypothetical protein